MANWSLSSLCRWKFTVSDSFLDIISSEVLEKKTVECQRKIGIIAMLVRQPHYCMYGASSPYFRTYVSFPVIIKHESSEGLSTKYLHGYPPSLEW